VEFGQISTYAALVGSTRKRLVYAAVQARQNRVSWRMRTRAEEAPADDPLSDEAERMLDDLLRDGIAITTVDALVGANGLDTLERSIRQTEVERAADIEDKRREALHANDFFDPFRISLWAGHPDGQGADRMRGLAERPEVQGIVDRYFGLRTQVSRVSAWRTFGLKQPARRSQLFHQDFPLDRYLVKAFVYFDQVDPDCGPLEFLPGTHPKGKVRIHPKTSVHDQLPRSSDEAIDAVYPRAKRVTCTGPPGTLVLSDTRGWHRGGWGQRDRLHAQALYTSRSALRIHDRLDR